MSKKLSEATRIAMKALSALSRDAKAAGEKDLMFAANRAWHELFDWGDSPAGRIALAEAQEDGK